MENEEKNIEENLLNNEEQISESLEDDLNPVEINSTEETALNNQISQKEKTIEEKLKEQDEFSFLDNEEPLCEKNE